MPKSRPQSGKASSNPAEFAELVFGFVYAVGTDADPVITTLKRYLRQYRYDAEEFRISERLQSLDLGISFNEAAPFEKMSALMDAGNKACERAADDRILAVMAINYIASGRTEDEQHRPVARVRTAHLIRSLKRPDEVHLLRNVYRPGFFLIGIADDDDAQVEYLIKELGLTRKEARRVIERDQDEERFLDSARAKRFTALYRNSMGPACLAERISNTAYAIVNIVMARRMVSSGYLSWTSRRCGMPSHVRLSWRRR
jgi:hypothetical protein